MNSNSSLLFSSSLPSPVCQSRHLSNAAKRPLADQTLQERLAHLKLLYPEASIFIQREGRPAVLAGNPALHPDLTAASPYLMNFVPTEKGMITLQVRRIRIAWLRCEYAAIAIAWRRRSEVHRSFEKSIARTMRALARLSK